jgi:hypothetical protein
MVNNPKDGPSKTTTLSSHKDNSHPKGNLSRTLLSLGKRVCRMQTPINLGKHVSQPVLSRTLSHGKPISQLQANSLSKLIRLSKLLISHGKHLRSHELNKIPNLGNPLGQPLVKRLNRPLNLGKHLRSPALSLLQARRLSKLTSLGNKPLNHGKYLIKTVLSQALPHHGSCHQVTLTQMYLHRLFQFQLRTPPCLQQTQQLRRLPQHSNPIRQSNLVPHRSSQALITHGQTLCTQIPTDQLPAMFNLKQLHQILQSLQQTCSSNDYLYI